MMATVRAWIFNLDRHWPKRIRVRHHWIYLCLRRLHAAPCPSLGLSVHFPCAYYDSSCSRMLTSHRGVPTRPSYANRCPKSIVLQPIAAPTTSRTGKQPFPPPPPRGHRNRNAAGLGISSSSGALRADPQSDSDTFLRWVDTKPTHQPVPLAVGSDLRSFQPLDAVGRSHPPVGLQFVDAGPAVQEPS